VGGGIKIKNRLSFFRLLLKVFMILASNIAGSMGCPFTTSGNA